MGIAQLLSLALVFAVQMAAAFSPYVRPRATKTIALKMALVTLPQSPPAVVVDQVRSVDFLTEDLGSIPSPLKQGILQYHVLSNTPSSNFLSELKERRPPTAEEIAQKKFNFNMWFWGGGFVAPFLATFYYFGLKFWEK